MFIFERMGVWGVDCGEVAALGVGVSIDYERMFKRFLVEGK